MTLDMSLDHLPDSPRLRAGRLSSRIASLPLHHRFALMGSIVSLVGMLIIGNLVAKRIETSVVRNSAISSAVYMESFIAPMSQELAGSQALSSTTIDRMRVLISRPPLSERVISAKIWREGGLLAFSSDPALIGRTFPPGEDLRRAWRGELTASFDDLSEDENLHERMAGVPLLEVYNPIHSIVTGEIIAVAEFYIDASELAADLRAAHAASWAVVAAVTALTFAALFGIVRAGSRTIDLQNAELTERIADLARISAQNAALRERIQSASRRASETNERYMRRISAELHDGPAQALALAALRLDALMRKAAVPHDTTEVRELKAALDEALSDVRDLCRGLTLPELSGRSIADTLAMAIGAHERRTGTTVARRVDPAPPLDDVTPHPTLICLYRFVQEGLMNVFRHAGGIGQAVFCGVVEGRLVVSVSDEGPGFDMAQGLGLGLPGLRERIESIGGEFRVESAPGRGTCLTLTLAPDVWT